MATKEALWYFFTTGTHSVLTDEAKSEKEWGGKIYYSHGTANSTEVAILIPEKLCSSFTLKNETSEQNGRVLLLECSIYDNPMVVISVYFPTKDKPKEQLSLLNYLRGLLINYGDQNILIGGDFNTCLNTNLDKMGGLTDNESQCGKGIKSLLTEIDLIDIWRIRNPNKLYYTRREMSRSGLVQSRLDFWLVSISLEFQITKCSIEPGNSSDHSLVKLTLETHLLNSLIETQKRWKGFWKFNNSLLTDSKYINIIKDVISDIKHSVVMENKAQLLDFIKCRIRSETISYSIFKAKESQRKENEWEGYQKEKF